MTSTAIDLSAIRTDQTSYKGTFRALIGVYSTAEVDALIDGVGGGVVVWGDIGGTLSNQIDLQNALNSKASSSHTHSQSDITNLTSDLALKASIVYVDAGLATKAAASHTHAQSDITNLTTDLAAKQATLVSGANIKTVNSTSLLGSGNISVGTIGGSAGATDNRILRADGTGGSTAQGSAVTVDDSGNISGLGSITGQSATLGSISSGGSLVLTGTGGPGWAMTLAVGFGGDISIQGGTASFGSFIYGYSSLFLRNASRYIGLGSTGYVGFATGTDGAGTIDVKAGRYSTTSAFLVNADGGVRSRNFADSSDAPVSGSNGVFSALLSCGTYTVSTLPSASSNAGRLAQVTDSSVSTFRTTVAGGGSTRVMVFSDGTNWVVV